MKSAKFTAVSIRHPDKRFDESDLTTLFLATARELNRKNVAWDIGETMLPSSFSDPGYLSLFEPNIESALRSLLASFVGEGSDQLKLERSRSGTRLTCAAQSPHSRAFVHIIFAGILNFLHATLPVGIAPVRAMYFAHSKPEGFDDQGRESPVRCYFDQPANFILFNDNVMDHVNKHANAAVLANAERQEAALVSDNFETKPLSKLVYKYLLFHLDKSGLSLDSTAETYDIAERTLRRRLVREGNSFRQILETVRRDTCALYFLEGNRSLSEIATKLGYSELSAFTRAYSAWHGHPPSRDQLNYTAKAA